VAQTALGQEGAGPAAEQLEGVQPGLGNPPLVGAGAAFVEGVRGIRQ
jgi:hypothetical protein